MPLGLYRAVGGVGRRLPPSGPFQELFTLWSWGSNSTGQLGSGNTTSTSSPNQVGSVATWTDVKSAQNFCLALRSNGTIWSWGSQGDGFGTITGTGLGSNSGNVLSPTQIGSATNWDKIAANGNIAAAITNNGQLWSWGSNSNGQVGDGTTSNRNTPVQIGSDTNWKEVNCGRNHKLAIKTNGSLWGWGANSSSQLGDGTTTQRTSPVQIGSVTTWKMVAGGQQHSLALRTNGTLWSWGNNIDGATGRGTTTGDTTSPTQIGTATDWAFVAAGDFFSFAIKTNGTLWAWGRNSSGQLGRGNTTTPQTTPIQIGSLTNWKSVSGSVVGSHAHGVTEDGKLWSWGENTLGSTGLGTTSGTTNSPTQIGTATDWGSASAGLNFGTALRKA